MVLVPILRLGGGKTTIQFLKTFNCLFIFLGCYNFSDVLWTDRFVSDEIILHTDIEKLGFLDLPILYIINSFCNLELFPFKWLFPWLRVSPFFNFLSLIFDLSEIIVILHLLHDQLRFNGLQPRCGVSPKISGGFMNFWVTFLVSACRHLVMKCSHFFVLICGNRLIIHVLENVFNIGVREMDLSIFPVWWCVACGIKDRSEHGEDVSNYCWRGRDSFKAG